MGWAGVKNGELLRLAAGRFGAFVTIDQGLAYQQNLALNGPTLTVILLVARATALRRFVRCCLPCRRHSGRRCPE